MGVLLKRLEQRQWDLGQILRDLTAIFKDELHALMMRAQSEAPIQRDQYSDFIQEMRKIYAQLVPMKGRGVHAK
ncbi:hypothetical protein BDV97DRAFT_396185 [Delphinella strobiligena]|nr:hypothetical protein BDV97DRAFT_396185 [Delphinella strobiligena]